MTVVVYGKPASRTFRVLWALEELGLRYESVPYDFAGPEIKEAAYLAINPNGAIPAISDDGEPLFESLAINLYLARKHGKLWPRSVRGEGLTFQWTLWAATEIETTLGAWFYHTSFLPEAERKAEVIEDAKRKLPKRFDVLEGALAKRAWLADADFGIADLNVAAVMFRAPAFGLERWPLIAQWRERCYARPAAKRAVAMRGTVKA
ncbi:MAG TPA: glutathione S-transferase family protein [Casimicrobiaceae bacterium]|nr:glutathione S-transferase family protein [Casimicrobiaceae bacterium]